MAAAQFALAGGASAQSVQKPKTLPIAEQAIRNFGICVVEHTELGARRVMAMEYGTRGFSRALARIAKGHDYCAPGAEMKFDVMLMGGSLGEALIRKDVGRDGLIRAVAAVQARPDPIKAVDAVEGVGLCMVMANPAAVYDLFETEPATPGAEQAFRALGGDIVNCVPQGQQMRLSRLGLRSILAIASYRIAREGGVVRK